MATSTLTKVIDHLRKAALVGSMGELTDGQLLGYFVEQKNEAAAHALVRRHGPMVWGVCRRILHDQHDAEDAFQATFLVLVRKATSIMPREMVGNWLYGVAHQTAVKARATLAKRRARESQMTKVPEPEAATGQGLWHDLEPFLDRELSRLPDKYRVAIVLCDLQGKTRKAAARQLRIPEGTISSRLTTARTLLAQRLARHGLAVSGGAVAVAMSQEAASACVPNLVVTSTIKAASLVAAGQALTAGAISAPIAALSEGVLKAMLLMKLKTTLKAVVVSVIVALTIIAGGAGLPGRGPLPSAALAHGQPDKSTAIATQTPEAKKQPRFDRFGDPLPPGAVTRLGTVRLRHAGTCWRVAFAPGGKLLASTGDDKLVRIWEPETGKEIRRCVGHTDAPGALAFAPDGKTLVSAAGDKTIRYWDPTTGQETRQSKCDDWVFSIAFSPDGQTLASGGEDKKVHLWDPATGQERRTLPADTEAVIGLAFSPDGKHLASGSRDNSIALWDVATGQELRRFKDLKFDVYPVLFSPDGKHLVVGNRSVHWLDLATGQEVKQLEALQGSRTRLAFSSDGTTLFSGSYTDGTIRVWDGAAARELRVLGKHRYVSDLALSPDGKILASCGGHMIRLWDVVKGKEIHLPGGHEMGVSMVAFAGDGKSVVSGAADGTIRRWDAATGEALGQIDPDATARDIVKFGLSPDATIAAVCRVGKDIRLWDVVKGQELPAAKPDGEPLRFTQPALSPGGQMLAVPLRGGVCLIDVKTGKELRKLPVIAHPPWANMRGQVLAFSPDGALLAAASPDPAGHFIRLFDTGSGNEVRLISKIWAGVTCLAFSPDGRTLASWHLESNPGPGVLVLWEVATGAMRSRIKTDGVYEDVLAFSPDGRVIASACHDKSVRLWEVATGAERYRLQGCGHVLALAFSADGSRLATGGTDTSTLIWDLGSAQGKPIANARLGHGELESLWADLAGADAARAHQAQAQLATAPKDTLSFLKERLRPVAERKVENISGLLADLDSEQFVVRKKAFAQLEKLGEAAVPALQKMLKGKISLEAQRRVEQLLNAINRLSPERLRALRALELLERLGTTESRQIVERLAAGAADAWLTEEATVVARRLASKQHQRETPARK